MAPPIAEEADLSKQFSRWMKEAQDGNRDSYLQLLKTIRPHIAKFVAFEAFKYGLGRELGEDIVTITSFDFNFPKGGSLEFEISHTFS